MHLFRRSDRNVARNAPSRLLTSKGRKMRIIRDAQMAVWQQQAFSMYRAEAIHHLRTELPDLTSNLTDEALLGRIRECLPLAEHFGFSELPELMAVVDATYLLDDVRFDLDTDYWWVAEILHCPYLTSMEKAIQLLDCAFAENQYPR